MLAWWNRSLTVSRLRAVNFSCKATLALASPLRAVTASFLASIAKSLAKRASSRARLMNANATTVTSTIVVTAAAMVTEVALAALSQDLTLWMAC